MWVIAVPGGRFLPLAYLKLCQKQNAKRLPRSTDEISPEMPPTTDSSKKIKAPLLHPPLSLKCLRWQAPFECETALTSPSVSPSDRSSLSTGEGLFKRTPPATGAFSPPLPRQTSPLRSRLTPRTGAEDHSLFKSSGVPTFTLMGTDSG